MLQIGITGGIGSGKTTVCRIFETLGIPVYYADDRAKAIMVEDPQLVKKIIKIFGKKAYLKAGSLNRPHIASIAFSDKEKLAMLNAAVHPAVRTDGTNWHNNQKNVPYTLKEAALMFESGNYQVLDKIITEAAPQKIRLKRVMLRDKSTAAQIKARMDKQMPEKEKKKLADFIIYNHGRRALIPQVLKIHRKLIQLAEKNQ